MQQSPRGGGSVMPVACYVLYMCPPTMLLRRLYLIHAPPHLVIPSMRVALLPPGTQEGKPEQHVTRSTLVAQDFALATFLLATALGLASPGVAVSTHTRDPPCPRAARTRSLTHLLVCHTFILLAIYPADSSGALPITWRGGGQLGHKRICIPPSGSFCLAHDWGWPP